MRSRYIEKNTVGKLKKALNSEEWLPLRLSLETGLRIGDVVSLRCRALVRHEKKPCIKCVTQKRKKLGYFPISNGLYKILRERRRRLVATAGPDEFLFPSYGKTRHLTRQAAWARMKRAAISQGIPPDGISPHSLRKCFAVALRHEHGLEAVKAALQHSNDAVTRVYAYSDTVLAFDSDAPIMWRDLEIVIDYILERLSEKSKNST